MKLRIAVIALLLGIANLTAADRPHNIFDDDWTPPKPAQSSRPAPKPQTPPPVDPNTKIAPPTAQPKAVAPQIPVSAPAPARLPIPTPAAQSAVRKVMTEVFADQLIDRSISARRKLTAALLAQVDKSAGAPVEQFVLLAAAVDSAVDAANLPSAFRAADRMAAAFDVDGLEIKIDAAVRIGFKAASPESTTENVNAALELSNELARADDYTAALRVCAALQPATSADPALRSLLQQRQRELSASREAADHFALDLARLTESPDDPDANLAAGRYLCFIKSEWEKGLPMLGKGSDPNLKTLAALELSNPKTPEEIANLADKWWDIVAKQIDQTSRVAVTAHAAALYDRAIVGITGLRKTQIEKRIAEAAKASMHAPGKTVVNLIKLIDVKRDAIGGTWKTVTTPAGTEIESPAKGISKIAIRYQPPEEYDFHIEFTRVSGEPSVTQVFTLGDHHCVWIAGWQNRFRGFATINGRNADENKTTLKGPAISTVGQRYSSLVQVRKGGIAAYLDGKLVAAYQTDGADLDVPGRWNIGKPALGLGTGSSDTLFHVVELIEIGGHGRPAP
jgi:hypothetical protein